ncbi:MAG: DUF5106 domain-containing protein [Alistipes sp.]|nr:DUF5106 domain-containing protein [Alistipes sp.]MBQ4531766.1 DUF5106 domain-containing protein [Alistipes sp.]
MKRLFVLLTFIILFSQALMAQEQTAPAAEKVTFPMVTVPDEITDPQARAKYLGEHFWDNVDFATASEALVEQGLIDMASIFPLLNSETLISSMTALVKKAETSKEGLLMMLSLADKYLYGTASPLYNEAAYRGLLQSALISKALNKADKEPYQKQLVILEMNNEGSAAVDFDMQLVDGSKAKLSDIEAPVSILFFYAADNLDCKLQRFRLTQARLVNYLQRAGGIKIVAVCVEGDKAAWEKFRADSPKEWLHVFDASGKIKSENLYDLRTLPRLYLLDEQKTVLLKNTKADDIEQYLVQIIQASDSVPASE